MTVDTTGSRHDAARGALAAMPSAASTAGRITQSTAVEQSRAVAEVQAAAALAQSYPRDTAAARLRMLDACSQRGLAERAFFRYGRGGSQVTGPSIVLARTLAQAWGNVQYGIAELERGDGESVMTAWAWDVETNTRPSTTFIVPHVRDTSSGSRPLTDQRDVYENNANAGARRLREQILAVLPAWFVEEAKTRCYETLAAEVPGKPLPVRVAEAIEAFHATFGVSRDALCRKVGRGDREWTPGDLATLHVVYTSLQRGEASVADEFPDLGPSAADVAAQAAASRARRSAAKAAPAQPDGVQAPPAGEPDPTTDPAFGTDEARP